MKKIFIPGIVAALCLASCNQDLGDRTPEPNGSVIPELAQGEGLLNVNIDLCDIPTKAASTYNVVETYEKQVNSIQILVFNNDNADNNQQGVIQGYTRIDSDGDSEAQKSGNLIKVQAGKKKVYAVANCKDDLSAIANLQQLEEWKIQLEDNSTTASEGFIMAGFTDKNTAGGDLVITSGQTASAQISLSRFTSRIALVRVENNLSSTYGDLVIDQIFLANVVGNQNLAGSEAASVWYNPQGRVNEETPDQSHIIGSAEGLLATCPSLTYNGTALTVKKGAPQIFTADASNHTTYLLYSFPNSNGNNGDQYQANFSGAKTRLILSAKIKADGQNATRFYYPVVIPKLERNKSYDVSVKISGFGVTNPEEVIEKGSIDASVVVSDWVLGESIEGDL